MNNFLRILALDEDSAQRSVFLKAREEGGINFIYDPTVSKEIFQVFIHNRFPYKTVDSWEFEEFTAARRFAAERFSKDWEMLLWEGKISRPCEEGGHECGSGSCPTCSSGGGCSDQGGCSH